jgi:drug/metabolite transporter (DMT)-like permease
VWPARDDVALLLLVGIAWFGVFNLALNAAEQRIDAATAALVIVLGPLVTAVLAVIFLKEALRDWVVVGIGAGVTGVALITLGSATSSAQDAGGVLLALPAEVAVGWPWSPRCRSCGGCPPVELTFLACLIGAAFCLPWAGELWRLVADGAPGLWWIVYLGVFPTEVLRHVPSCMLATWCPGSRRIHPLATA